MRFDKFTIKSQELIQNAQSLAGQHNNQQIEPEHLMAAMLSEKDGVAGSLLRKLGASPDEITRQITATVDRLPKVTGGGDGYLSSQSKAILEKAFSEAAAMKDEYVSIEHILLAVVEAAGSAPARILRRHGVDRNALLKALMEIRGSQRITDPNPEEKYQALEKFSRDLTELARMGKLDPVIGRAMTRSVALFRCSHGGPRTTRS